MNIEIISSSPRSTSLTNRVALHLQKHLTTKTQHNIGLIDVRDWKLGLLEKRMNTHHFVMHKDLEKIINS